MVRLLLIGVITTLATGPLSGQQPNRKPEPYVALLLPAGEVWSTTLAAPPAAEGALDDHQVYVPLQEFSTLVDGESVPLGGSASIVALDRASGAARWNHYIESVWPPVVGGDTLFVVVARELVALNTATGLRQWRMDLPADLRAPMILRGNLLLALTAPDVLIAIRTDTREVAWRLPLGEPGAVLMNADQRAVFVTTARGRVMRVNIADGSRPWNHVLDEKGQLSAPAIGPDRLFVGSTTRAFWALDAKDGKTEWSWPAGRFFGGSIAGAAVDGDTVYVASLDNLLRGLDYGSGNLRWKQPTGTRPTGPPRAFFGTVVVTGLSPMLATFGAKKGEAVSMWSK